MLLGKRPRTPIRKTTSMTAITLDLPAGDDDHSKNSDNNMIRDSHDTQEDEEEEGSPNYDSVNSMSDITTTTNNNNDGFYDHRFLSTMVSPRNLRRSSGDFLETAHFLRTCGLCKRRLAPGKDIYMYRGDTAFCSLECREKQMKHDESK